MPSSATSRNRARSPVVPRALGPERGQEGSRPRRLGLLLVQDDLGEGPAVDELHRIVVHAPLAPDREDRHDVGVVELGGGVGLGLESPELGRVERRGERQHLERDAAPQRDLLGLVNDPHPPRPSSRTRR